MALEAKIRLLEARLTGSSCGNPEPGDVVQEAGLSRSQKQGDAASGSPQRADGEAQAHRAGRSAAGGRVAAAAQCLELSSASPQTPFIQIDTSLDSDGSGNEGSADGGSGGQPSRWGIVPGDAAGSRPEARPLPSVENSHSRSGAGKRPEADDRPDPAQLKRPMSNQRDGQCPSKKAKSDPPAGTATPEGAAPSAPRSAGTAHNAPRRAQRTINRYFPALSDSCSRDSGAELANGGDDGAAREVRGGSRLEAACQTEASEGAAAEDARRMAARVAELETAKAEAEAALAEARQRQSQAGEEASGLRSEVERLREQSEAREKRVQEAVVRVLQEGARHEQRAADAQLQQDSLRLGGVCVRRTGAMLTEVWQDGPAFQEIARRQSLLSEERDRIEALRKSLKKQLPLPEGIAGGSRASSSQSARKEQAGSITPKEYVMREEALKMRLQALRREEDALQRDKDKLESERLRYLRELRRRKDEDESRFCGAPLMHQRYVLTSLLGKGGFSEVFRAFDLQEMQDVAVKMHQLNSAWGEAKKQSYVRHAVREYNIHKSLKHPRVVGLLDIFEVDNNTFATVLEMCPGGDLEGRLREHHTLPEREARAIVLQILEGLAYLNEPRRRIIHYDLKPANIMFDGFGCVKITDFGLSKIVEEGQTNGMELTSQGAGTYWYLPPECFETNAHGPPMISSKVDVWSVGVIFYQMLYGRRPFGHELSQENILREKTITNAQAVEFPSKPSVSAEGKEFIRRCLAYRQQDRPDVQQAFEDAYLSSANGRAGEKRTK